MARDLDLAHKYRVLAVESAARLEVELRHLMTLMVGLGQALDVERVSVDEWRKEAILRHWDAFVNAATAMRQDFVGLTAEEMANG